MDFFQLLNHYDTTDSPRTNNHIEGINRSLNFHVITNKPSIYEFKQA
jgi:hypothetical protein